MSKLEVSERQEQLLRMRYIDGADIDEIAEILKTSERSIARELQRVRRLIDKVDALQLTVCFCCNTATEAEMRERCRRLGKGQEWTNFCVDAFIYKLTRKEMSAKWGLEPGTIKAYKHDRKRELEKR